MTSKRGAVKGQALAASAVFVLLLLAVPAAWADSSVTYPDRSISIVWNLGGGVHVNIFWDIPGDNDIFVHNVNFFGNFVSLSVAGFPSGLAYWCDFRGLVGPQMLFDVWVNQGFGFFFVGQLTL